MPDNAITLHKLAITTCIVCLISIVSHLAFAQNDSRAIDWDKVDNIAFNKLKQERRLPDAEIYELLGKAYAEENRADRAVLNFCRALAIDSNRYLSWYYLGLFTMNNPEQCFKKVIEVKPYFPDSYYWLASYYCRSKNKKESIRYFEEYIVVAKGIPLEEERIEVAHGFIDAMGKGEVDYDTIVSNMISTHKENYLSASSSGR